MAGLYVANLGMVALRSMNLDNIKVYVKSLALLAICSVSLRVLWYIDVVDSVTTAYRHRNDITDDAVAGDGGEGGSESIYYYDGASAPSSETQTLTKSVVVAVIIQVYYYTGKPTLRSNRGWLLLLILWGVIVWYQHG
jgi:hypothetical protein